MALLLAVALTACSGDYVEMSTAAGRSQRAERELQAARSSTRRFYMLGDAAKTSFDAGEFGKAKAYADELERLTPTLPRDWNYGNAIQDFNVVRGRLALRNGKVSEAKAHLLAAGHSPGSPQMDSFGPNMSLANDLLKLGERDVVVEYFTLCRTFWKDDYGKLDRWAADVRAGTIPDFGANLIY